MTTPPAEQEPQPIPELKEPPEPSWHDLLVASLRDQVLEAQTEPTLRGWLDAAAASELLRPFDDVPVVRTIIEGVRQRVDGQLLSSEEKDRGVTLDHGERNRRIARELGWEAEELGEDPVKLQKKLQTRGLELAWERVQQEGRIQLTHDQAEELVSYVVEQGVTAPFLAPLFAPDAEAIWGLPEEPIEQGFTKLSQEPDQALALAQVYLPDSLYQHEAFRKVYANLARRFGLEARGRPVNPHFLARLVAENLDRWVDFAGIPERLRWQHKLLSVESLYEGKIIFRDFRSGSTYLVRLEYLSAFLEGRKDSVLMTEQRAAGRYPQQELVIRARGERGRIIPKQDRPALLPFAGDISHKEAVQVVKQALHERELLREAVPKLVKEGQGLRINGRPNAYLVTQVPGHMQEDEARSRDIFGKVKNFADRQIRWERGIPINKKSWRTWVAGLGFGLTEATVGVLPEYYQAAESWLTRTTVEVLDNWCLEEYMGKKILNRTFSRAALADITWERQDTQENRDLLAGAWRRIPGKTQAVAGAAFEDRFQEFQVKEKRIRYLEAVALSRLPNDRSAVRLYGEEPTVVDMGKNLNWFRLLVDDHQVLFSIPGLQRFGYMDQGFNFTDTGVDFVNDYIYKMLTKQELETLKGVKTLVDEKGRFARFRYQSDEEYVSPFATLAICSEGYNPYDGIRRRYVDNAEQIFTSIHHVRLGNDGKTLFWDRATKMYTHFCNDGVLGARIQERIVDGWLTMLDELPKESDEAQVLEDYDPAIDPVEIYFDSKGLPDRVITRSPVSRAERELEKAGLDAFQSWYKGEYDRWIVPMIDRLVERDYRESGEATKARAREALRYSTEIKFFNVLTEVMAKSLASQATTAVAVAPNQEVDMRLFMGLFPRHMAILGQNRGEKEKVFDKAWEAFQKDGRFAFVPESLNLGALLISMNFSGHDIEAARHGEEALKIIRHIDPRREEVMQHVTEKVSPQLEEILSGGSAQVSALRFTIARVLENLFFITSDSKYYYGTEMGIASGKGQAKKTGRSRVGDAEKARLREELADVATEEQRSEVLKRFKQGYQLEATRQTLFKGCLLAQLIGRLNPNPAADQEQALKRQEAERNLRQLYEDFAALQPAAEL